MFIGRETELKFLNNIIPKTVSLLCFTVDGVWVKPKR